jgi:predicted metal-dependent phosphoesterase TrpH
MKHTYKIDLHTHSYGSPDGGLTLGDYRTALTDGTLSSIAVTDHDTIEAAQKIQQKIGGDKIIVGEEITTADGEIIGLYLTQAIPPGLSAIDTAQQIRDQDGLVYVPHPFETLRKGITHETLTGIAEYVDIIEAYNGRAVFQNTSNQALGWAKTHRHSTAASSDAHGKRGLGYTYTMVHKIPTKETLIELLVLAKHVHAKPPLRSLLYPKYHRLRKKVVKA